MLFARALPAFLSILTLLTATATAATPENLVVTANRSGADPLTLSGNITRLPDAALTLTAATHPYEISVRVPGTWISRNSGQEQLTAIRSPVLTGPGSCGAFLVLEDGIATRPTGFCNVNQLFEVPTEMADSIEFDSRPRQRLVRVERPARHHQYPPAGTDGRGGANLHP